MTTTTMSNLLLLSLSLLLFVEWSTASSSILLGDHRDLSPKQQFEAKNTKQKSDYDDDENEQKDNKTNLQFIRDTEHRDLQLFGFWNEKPPGPFDAFNTNFLNLIKFYVPDQFLDSDELPNGFPEDSSLSLKNFFCTNTQVEVIEDEVIRGIQQTQQTFPFNSDLTRYSLRVDELEVDCRLDWTYYYYFEGELYEDNGGSILKIRKSSLNVAFVMESEDMIISQDGKSAGVYPVLARPEQW